MSRIDEVSVDGVVRQRWDYGSRRYTEYDAVGVKTLDEPFDADRNSSADEELVKTTRETNESQLKTPATIDQAIAELTNRVGSGSYVATGIQDPLATIMSLSLMQNAALATDFQNNTGRWLKFLLRDDKRLSNQTIRLLRLVGERVDSASLGDET